VEGQERANTARRSPAKSSRSSIKRLAVDRGIIVQQVLLRKIGLPLILGGEK
jgi:hypothetical protein